jgi:hypothetical protein
MKRLRCTSANKRSESMLRTCIAKSLKKYDEIELKNDPVFRSAFLGYIEWEPELR